MTLYMCVFYADNFWFCGTSIKRSIAAPKRAGNQTLAEVMAVERQLPAGWAASEGGAFWYPRGTEAFGAWGLFSWKTCQDK